MPGTPDLATARVLFGLLATGESHNSRASVKYWDSK